MPSFRKWEVGMEAMCLLFPVGWSLCFFKCPFYENFVERVHIVRINESADEFFVKVLDSMLFLYFINFFIR
jgi:hypothetical protein